MSEMKRVKIEYNGGAAYTAKVTDAETGADIPNVYRVDFSLDANADATDVKLYSYTPAVQVTANASIHKVCPHCGQEVNNG